MHPVNHNYRERLGMGKLCKQHLSCKVNIKLLLGKLYLLRHKKVGCGGAVTAALLTVNFNNQRIVSDAAACTTLYLWIGLDMPTK